MTPSGGTSARYWILFWEAAILTLQRLMLRSIRTGLYVIFATRYFRDGVRARGITRHSVNGTDPPEHNVWTIIHTRTIA